MNDKSIKEIIEDAGDSWTKEMTVKLLVFNAELTIDNFERVFPNNKQPREAIQAAKNWLEDPSEENRDAAWGAFIAAWAASRAAWDTARAAWASWDARDASRAAARAAAWVARAAAGVARAAGAATYIDSIIEAENQDECKKYILNELLS